MRCHAEDCNKESEVIIQNDSNKGEWSSGVSYCDKHGFAVAQLIKDKFGPISVKISSIVQNG